MAAEPDFRYLATNEKRVHAFGRIVGPLAARQHGVVAARQLVAAGLARSSIAARVRSGLLHRVHRGVYAVGTERLTIHGRWMAAVLAGGPGAVLSHRPAGSAWNLREWTGRQAVTVPGWRRDSAAIEFHCARLPADETTVREGIPITSVPRTILDLATILDPRRLARVVEEAEFQGLSDRLSLPALIARHRGERGTGRLREVLAAAGYGKGVTKRELEERFVRFLGASGLPHPELNASLAIGGRTVSADCLWRRRRLIVELHSARFHGTAPAISRDASRDRTLMIAGWRVIHVTWAQLTNRPERRALAADLERLLRA